MQAFCYRRGCFLISLAILLLLLPFCCCDGDNDIETTIITNATTTTDVLDVDSLITSWKQIGNDIDGEEDSEDAHTNDNLRNNEKPFGWSISLSSDGRTVAIGMASNDGDGDNDSDGNNGIKKMDSGHVRIYRRYDDDDDWIQLGGDIDGLSQRDWFGFSVSLSSNGNTVAIGSPLNDHHNSTSGITTKDTGRVCVYRYNDNNDDGDSATTSATAIGSWNQLGNAISGHQTAKSDLFGWSLSLSSDGTIVAVGSPSGTGYVDIYHLVQWSSSSYIWENRGTLYSSGQQRDFFGESVSLSSDGRTVAIGIPRNDVDVDVDVDAMTTADDEQTATTMIDSGTVRIYKYQNSTSNSRSSSSYSWIQFGNDIHGKEDKVLFGKSVALSSNGDTVAIGSGKKNNDDNTIRGNVRVYKSYYNDDNTTADNNNAVAWQQIGNDLDGENAKDLFGDFVSLSSNGQMVAIAGFKNSATGDDNSDNNNNNNGRVRIYKLNNVNQNNNTTAATWEQFGNIIDGSATDAKNKNNHTLGYFVSLSSDGKTVAVGGIKKGSNSGHVEVYQLYSPPSQSPSTVPSYRPSAMPSYHPSHLRRPTITANNDALMETIVEESKILETIIITISVVVIIIFVALLIFYFGYYKGRKQTSSPSTEEGRRHHRLNNDSYNLDPNLDLSDTMALS